MKHNIYSVYDSKAEAYLLPFCLPTKGLAVRGFTDAANNPQHDFCKYPADYTMFEIGIYDDANGQIEQYDAAINMGAAIEFKNKETQS